MFEIERRHDLTNEERNAVSRLIFSATDQLGHRPIPDQLWLDLRNASSGGAAFALASIGGELVGYAQASPAHGSWTMGVVLAADATDVALLAGSLARAMRAAIADEGGGSVNWWVLGSDEVLDSAASDVGLDEVRTLLQLRVPLPLTGRAGAGVEVRAFRPGVDERAWLEVNNAAFHWHPEQGGWDLDTLEQREREPWFDPQGFLLYERDGRVAAFCWTKIHDDTDPVLGEIYVIAVHPDFHGLGLGRALTAAGLQHLADRGIQTGMLYVDGTNSAAISLYQSMGFEVHRIDRAHFGIVPPTPAPVSF